MTRRTSPPASREVLPSEDLRARVMLAAEREPAASRFIGRRRRVGRASAAAVALLAGSLAVAHPSLGGRSMGYVASLAASWAVIGLAATWASLTRGGSMLGRRPAWRVGVAVVTPLALLASSHVMGLVWPPPSGDVSLGAHAFCFLLTCALALGPLTVLLALYGATDPVSPRLTAAALASAAGAWGAVAIELHCGFASSVHVVVGHVLPVVLLAIAGVLAARFVAVRAEDR